MTLGCLEYTLEEGARWGWLDDNTILLTSVLALVSFILFAARTLTISNPIMDLHAFKDKNFTLGCFFFFWRGWDILYCIFNTCVFGADSRIKCRRDRFCRLHNRYFPVIFCSLYFWLSKNKSAMAVDGGAGRICVFNVSFTPITHEWGWQELLFPQAIRGISQQFAMAPIVTLTLGNSKRTAEVSLWCI